MIVPRKRFIEMPQITGCFKIPYYRVRNIALGFTPGTVRGFTLIDAAIHYNITDCQQEYLFQADIIKVNALMWHNIEYLKSKGYSYNRGKLFYKGELRIAFKIALNKEDIQYNQLDYRPHDKLPFKQEISI